MIAYTLKGEDTAIRMHKQIILASRWLKEIHRQIRENQVGVSTLLIHDAKKQLDQELPTTFIKATEQRMLSEYIPLRLQFIRQYHYKIENAIPFTVEDIYWYIQMRASKAFLYEAILDSILPEYISELSQPLYGLWQVNELIASCITYHEQKDSSRPNVITIAEHLHNRQGTVEDVLKKELHFFTEQIQGYTFPPELVYLSHTPKVLEDMGISVFKNIGVN